MSNLTLKGLVSKTENLIASTLITDELKLLEKQAEKETHSIEISYTQQKGIGAKPSIIQAGETLQTHSLPLKLHSNFCDPDEIINKLEQRAKNKEPFQYFQGEAYEGLYVITKVLRDTISRRNDGSVICADLTVELLEVPIDEEEEFQQQKKEEKKPQSKLQKVREKLKVPEKLKKSLNLIPDSIKAKGLGYLDDMSNGLASEALSSDSLLDVALRNTQSYLNVKTNGISDELWNIRRID